jgi:hypothetical protein
MPVRTKVSRAKSVNETITALVRFDRRIPLATTIVNRPTAASARPIRGVTPGCPKAFSTYPAKPSAAVAADADFALRNIHPAVKPSVGFR